MSSCCRASARWCPFPQQPAAVLHHCRSCTPHTHAPQKDPGEYLLELQRWSAIPHPLLRRHAIDMQLR